MTQDVLDTIIGAGRSADPQAAEAHFQAGLNAESAGDRLAALEEYRQASRLDSKAQYVFKLAYLLDLLGEEDEAVGLYEQLCSSEQPYVNALLNLAIIYEDRGEISKAESRTLRCLRMEGLLELVSSASQKATATASPRRSPHGDG